MRRRATATLAAALLAVACERTAEPVRVGVIAGGAAGLIAADAINAAGGVRGRPVAIVLDSLLAGDVTVEIGRAQSMVRHAGLVGVIGHGGSRESLAAAPVYNEARVLQIVPTGTSRLLERAGPWTLTLVPNDSVEGAFIARFVAERLRARTVVIFYVSTEYGIGLRDGLRGAFAGSAVRVLREQRYDASNDLGTLLDAALLNGVPDVLVVAGQATEPGVIARHLRGLRLPTQIVAGDGSDQLSALVAAGGPAADGIYVATFWRPAGSADTASQSFAQAFVGRFARPPSAVDALIYDAVLLLGAAVRAVGDDPAAIRRYVLELGRSRPRFRGVTGEIGFGSGAGPPRLTMGVVRGESLVPVEPAFR